MRAVTDLQIPMHAKASGQLATLGWRAWHCLPVAGMGAGMVTALAVAGLITLWQVLAWKPWAVRKVPLLWILYLGHAALGAAGPGGSARASSWVLHAWPGRSM